MYSVRYVQVGHLKDGAVHTSQYPLRFTGIALLIMFHVKHYRSYFMAIFTKRPLIYMPRKKKGTTSVVPQPYALQACADNWLTQGKGTGSITYGATSFTNNGGATLNGNPLRNFPSNSNTIRMVLVETTYSNPSFVDNLKDLRWLAGDTYSMPFAWGWGNTGTGGVGPDVYRFYDSTKPTSTKYQLGFMTTHYPVTDPEMSGYTYQICKFNPNYVADMQSIVSKITSDSLNLKAILIASKDITSDILSLVNDLWGHNYWGQHTAVVDYDIN